MSCCTTGMGAVAAADAAADNKSPAPIPGAPDVTPYVRADGAGRQSLALMVEGIHCGNCVRTIERALHDEPDVRQARVNMTTRRLNLAWDGPAARGGDFVARLGDLGYTAIPYDPERLSSDDARAERELLRAMAVAGFAMANVMLLSVSVWAGHAQGMTEATRDLLHWFSALIALPAIAYAGRPFFRSAVQALSAKRTNMDVPISLAVILAGGISLSETIQSGQHAYFDSAVALLFFLLLGRYLERRARGRARSAAERLLALRSGAVTVLDPDGSRRVLPAEQLEPGMRVLVAAGERIAADGTVVDGRGELDTSLITGESLPRPAGPGTQVYSGTLNLSAPLTLRVTAVGEDTLLAEIVRLMETAEQRRAKYVAIADRVARAYSPVVHLLALAAFAGWVFLGGMAWQPALLIAVAVLIITCPCALALAVPAVQVIASGRLMKAGILLKSGTALERLTDVDTVAFDKTGTLTVGRPELHRDGVDPDDLRVAASLAGASSHPLARALSRAAPDAAVAEGVREAPGSGLAWTGPDGREIRLGKRSWVGVGAGAPAADGPELWLARPGRDPVRFGFDDPLRADAAEVVAALQAQGRAVILLSGDRPETVRDVAARLGLADWQAECTPQQKVERLQALAGGGRRVLMVGDGLNDAPALAAATVSVSPSSAADISQTAADAVFQGDRLAPVLELLDVARRSGRLVRQNFALAFGYNALAVPLAVAGFVTPLIAALAMSGSSLAVTGNALRLGLKR
jgi:Cu2+-exporting ATPase